MTAPDMPAADYAEFYRALVADESVRPRRATHPRISIWEPYEARLQQPDVVILGSLNEGTWPQAADPGPWLNRPMRQALGLPAPEERIGEAAHIFISLLGAERVYLTRAAKIDGVPTVPSRWLLRLQALLAGLGQTAQCRPAVARLGAGAQCAGRSGAARACARAAPAAGAAAAPAQRDDDREMDRQPLRDLRRAHPRAGAAAGAGPRARCGAARPDRARRARPLRAALPDSSCRRTSAAS